MLAAPPRVTRLTKHRGPICENRKPAERRSLLAEITRAEVRRPDREPGRERKKEDFTLPLFWPEDRSRNYRSESAEVEMTLAIGGNVVKSEENTIEPCSPILHFSFDNEIAGESTAQSIGSREIVKYLGIL